MVMGVVREHRYHGMKGLRVWGIHGYHAGHVANIWWGSEVLWGFWFGRVV